MTAQSTGSESLTAQDWQEILTSPTFGGSRAIDEGEHPVVLAIGNNTLERQERNLLLSSVVLEIALQDSDDRLEFLATVNPALAEADLDQIAIVREQWLNGEGRKRLRDLALHYYENEWHPKEMLPQVSSPEELDRLADLLSKTEITDKTLATCYVIVEAYDVAHAAYVIQRERNIRPTDYDAVQQSPEEIADDLRFTRLR